MKYNTIQYSIFKLENHKKVAQLVMIDLSSTRGALVTLTHTTKDKLKPISVITKPLLAAYNANGASTTTLLTFRTEFEIRIYTIINPTHNMNTEPCAQNDSCDVGFCFFPWSSSSLHSYDFIATVYIEL